MYTRTAPFTEIIGATVTKALSWTMHHTFFFIILFFFFQVSLFSKSGGSIFTLLSLFHQELVLSSFNNYLSEKNFLPTIIPLRRAMNCAVRILLSPYHVCSRKVLHLKVINSKKKKKKAGFTTSHNNPKNSVMPVFHGKNIMD